MIPKPLPGETVGEKHVHDRRINFFPTSGHDWIVYGFSSRLKKLTSNPIPLYSKSGGT